VLAGVDVLLLTDVYPAGETPIQGADGRALARAVRARGGVEPVYVDPLDELPDALRAVMAPNDVVLTLGAGSIGALAADLPNLLGVPAALEGRS
jgi:UDP-N-acetylmuramate--alanine ligase